jgi:hypothetical protein
MIHKYALAGNHIPPSRGDDPRSSAPRSHVLARWEELFGGFHLVPLVPPVIDVAIVFYLDGIAMNEPPP